MKNSIIAAFILSILSISVTFGQKDTPFDKKLFPDQKDALKEAEKEMEKGDKLFLYDGNFAYALKHYMKAYDFNPNYSLLNYRIGYCILQGHHKTDAVKYLDKAYQLNPEVAKDIEEELGYAHHLNEDWDEAIKWYKAFERKLMAAKDKKNAEQIDYALKKIEKRIQECKNGKELSKTPIRVFIDNMGPEINSEYPEYGISLSADESIVMVTSKRPGSTGFDMLTEKDIQKEHKEEDYAEDIYVAYKGTDGKWTKLQNMGKPINTDEHDATVNLSADGMSLLMYNSDNGGDLFESHLEGDKWSRPKDLGKPINSKFHDSHATYSPDKKRIYFVSSREEDNYGIVDPASPFPGKTHDIYYSDWDEDKERWGDVKNIGPVINTPYNEAGVFMHPDGRTLYFSSEGHNTMGSYDIFKSVYDEEKGQWSKPENLGYPVNGPDVDAFFVISANNRRGYFAANHTDSYGEEDIYVITFLGPEKQAVLVSEDNLLASEKNPISQKIIEPKVALSSAKTTILKGRTLDEMTGEPVGSSIELVDNNKNKLVATFKSNSATGKFLVSLPSGTNYGIAVKAEGYLFHSENFDLPDTAAFQEVEKDIFLKKVVVGKSIVLRNIFFDVAKSTLRSESTAELNRLVALMDENPTIRIEIGGHTDNVGSDEYNQKLSENRAKAVVDYLIANGINKSRLEWKGYGETTPLATNDTPEGRQQNRRTEFKIIK